MQSDYKCICGLQNPEGKNSTFGIACTKTQSTFHTAHMNFNTWIDARVIPCAHSPAVRFWSSWFAHNIVAQVWLVRISYVHTCSECFSSTLSSPFHPTSSSPHLSSISCSPSCISSTTLRAVATLRASPEKEMDSTDESYFLTGYKPKSYDLKEIYVESYTESLIHPQFSEQGYLEDVEYDDTASRICFTITEYMSFTPSKTSCLSVSRRRPCPSERWDPLESEHGDLLDQVVRS